MKELEDTYTSHSSSSMSSSDYTVQTSFLVFSKFGQYIEVRGMHSLNDKGIYNMDKKVTNTSHGLMVEKFNNCTIYFTFTWNASSGKKIYKQVF